jgi:hypothetical protein
MFKSGVKHDHEKKKRNNNLTPQVKNEINFGSLQPRIGASPYSKLVKGN